MPRHAHAFCDRAGIFDFASGFKSLAFKSLAGPSKSSMTTLDHSVQYLTMEIGKLA
jgi:hypothetical protein